jgi:hypothetical protein
MRPGRTFGSRQVVAATALVIVALVATSCSSSSKPAAGSSGGTTTQAPKSTSTPAKTAKAGGASSKGTNPCTLITPAEVQAIVGTVPKPVGPTSANRGTSCKWDTGKGSFVLVQVYQGKEFYAPSAQSNSPKNLAGVGDQAFEDASGTTTVNVGFLKGSTAVFISGFYVESADAVVQAAKDAASKV